jgi:hypothetical protein
MITFRGAQAKIFAIKHERDFIIDRGLAALAQCNVLCTAASTCSLVSLTLSHASLPFCTDRPAKRFRRYDILLAETVIKYASKRAMGVLSPLSMASDWWRKTCTTASSKLISQFPKASLKSKGVSK